MSSYTLAYKNSEGADMSVSLMATDQYLTGESTAPKGITILEERQVPPATQATVLLFSVRTPTGNPIFPLSWGHPAKRSCTSR